MANINTATFFANVCSSEMRNTKGGKVVQHIRACIKNTRKIDGEFKDHPCFVEVEVWSDDSYEKGDQIFVSGPLWQDHWETPDGDKRQKMYVKANSVKKLQKANYTKTEPKRIQSILGPKEVKIDEDDFPF
jgi:single-stranded DNA-binding protein